MEFEEAFDHLFPRAFRVARRLLPSDAAAEDVAAEALARAYAHWKRLAHAEWRDGWVVKVASNLAVDAVRKDARLRDLPVEETGRPDADVALRLGLAEALGGLSRRQRDVVSLRYVGGFSEKETAEALGVSPGSVKTHASRGLAALRLALGPEAGVLESEGVAADA